MTRPRAITTRFALVSTGMLWLSTFIAASSFWPVYASVEFLIMIGVTTAVGSCIAILGAVYRLPAHVVALMVLLAYLLFGVPLAVPGQALLGVVPTVDGLGDLVIATALSWKQLLTISLPVGSYQALLVPAFLLTLVSVTAALSIALRSRRRELATLGPVVLFISGIVFGASAAFRPVWQSLALLASLLLWIVWFTWYRRRATMRRTLGDAAGRRASASDDSTGMGLRTLVSATVIIAIAGSAGVGAAILAAPTTERTVLRSAIVQPFDPRAYTSPLSGFRRYLQADQADSPMLVVTGLPDGARLRIATLDTYDGVVFSVGSSSAGGPSGEFTLVPSAVDQSATPGTSASIDVEVGAYRGVWVPTLGALERISFSGSGAIALRGALYYNANSRTAADLEELTGGESYRLEATIPAGPGPAGLASLVPGDAVVPRLSVIPDELSVALDRYVGQTTGAGARLQAAIDGLREEGYVSHGVGPDEPRSRSGHSADRITELFTERQMIGDEEQYAVAAAIMARSLGFPARVVMGFVPDVTGAETTITGSDISAWIEVDTGQFGWVTIDPTPLVREIPEIDEETPAQVARPQSPVQPPAELDQPVDDQQPPESASEDVPVEDPLAALLVLLVSIGGWTLLTLAIVAAPFLGIVVAKVRRRSLRRRNPSTLGRIIGAWREFTDTAVDRGVTPPAAPTRSEFAMAVGGVQPLVLAAAADRAVFAPGGVTNAEADRMWRSVDELRVTLDRGLTRSQRWRALVSLRSLGGRRRVRRGRGSTR